MKTTSIRSVVSLLVLLAALGCSSVPASDSDALQGSWKGHEVGREGVCRIVVTGKGIECHATHPNDWYKGTFALREDTNPRQVDFHITECGAPPYVGKVSHAIYRIEQGTLTITGNEPGNPAVPASFDAPGARRFELKRE